MGSKTICCARESMADRYVRGKQLGAGTWGGVYEATRKSDGLQVAIKIIGSGTQSLDPREGQHFTALREIKYLQDVRGDHIIDVSPEILCLFSIDTLPLTVGGCLPFGRGRWSSEKASSGP